MLSGTGRGRLPTRSAIARLDHGCVADLQYETRYAGEYRSALNFPVYLLEKLNDEPELEQRGAWLSEGEQAQISRQSCKGSPDSASRWARDAKGAST
jgi:hypothetical protein